MPWACGVLPQPDRADPAERNFPQDGDDELGAILQRFLATSDGFLPADLRSIISWAAIDAFFGFIVAWVLARYSFRASESSDAMVDLPFALPTAVAGISLTSLYATHGWIGRYLDPLGIKGVYSRLRRRRCAHICRTSVCCAKGAAGHSGTGQRSGGSLRQPGSERWQTFSRVIFPTIVPALLTGFTLAFARGLGEYGSVIFISGNMPMQTEITSLLIVSKLEQYDYAGATAIAVVMLVVSFTLLLAINLLQKWSSERLRSGHSSDAEVADAILRPGLLPQES